MESARTYQNMTVVQLRELARANKVRLPYGVNKAQMVETLFRQLGAGRRKNPPRNRKSAVQAQAVRVL